MRIYLAVNFSQVVRYKEQVKEQKVEKVKLVKVNKVEEWKVKNSKSTKNKRSCEILGKMKGVYYRT